MQEALYTPRIDRVENDQYCWEPKVEHISTHYAKLNEIEDGTAIPVEIFGSREIYSPTPMTAQPNNESRGENYMVPNNIYRYT